MILFYTFYFAFIYFWCSWSNKNKPFQISQLQGYEFKWKRTLSACPHDHSLETEGWAKLLKSYVHCTTTAFWCLLWQLQNEFMSKCQMNLKMCNFNMITNISWCAFKPRPCLGIPFLNAMAPGHDSVFRGSDSVSEKSDILQISIFIVSFISKAN